MKALTVHPHARGDNERARHTREVRLRFTPTPVGTIAQLPPCRESLAVHPHARGDNAINCTDQSAGFRFTPTPVGTMAPQEVRKPRKTVHPHARGDNYNNALNAYQTNGSPPRPWGQFRERVFGAADQRFTPTPVGTMQANTGLSDAHAVHPHARGDNVLIGHGRSLLNGSPPRPWGQL